MSRVRPADHPSCVPKTLTLDFVRILFNHFFFILIDTIDFYYFTLPSLTLTLPGVKGQRKAKPMGFTFSHIFQLIIMKFDLVLKHSMLNILIVFFSEIQ